MKTSTFQMSQGQLVQVRSSQWVVNDIKASTLTSSLLKASVAQQQHLLSLSSVEDDGLGEELQVVWEIEPGAKVMEFSFVLILSKVGTTCDN